MLHQGLRHRSNKFFVGLLGACLSFACTCVLQSQTPLVEKLVLDGTIQPVSQGTF